MIWYTILMMYFFRKLVMAVLLVIIVAVLIALARGYRFNPSDQVLSSTGILVANSNPDGAMILVNGKLEGATNSNIVLKPGSYSVEIKKDGFTSWKRNVSIKGELVVQANALLFPQNPTLSPVTSLGVVKAFSSLSGDKIMILSNEGDPKKDGLYLLENTRNPITRINPLGKIVLKSAFTSEPASFDFSKTHIEFSPDEKQILVTTFTTVTTPGKNATSSAESAYYLLDATSETESPLDVTDSIEAVKTAWAEEKDTLRIKSFKGFKKPFAEVALKAFDVIAFSPDENHILYVASTSATIPQVIKPALVSPNQTPETRTIEPNNVYVYDAEEDRNYLIMKGVEGRTAQEYSQILSWYPTSRHLIFKEADKISAMDYDGTNKRTVYSGPFSPDFLAPSKDGKLFILTNFNSESGELMDLYSIGLK